MATPYLQIRVDETTSTQDLAREALDDLPVVAIASTQTRGRGRSGATWETAPRALAVSVAAKLRDEDRPLSLMAGVAAVRALGDVALKWPNDVLAGEVKIGGILVERSLDVVVTGMGVNLWWPDPPSGIGGLFPDDPGGRRHLELGSVWAAELMRLLNDPGWPRDEYRHACRTLGREISWEPGGMGKAVDVAEDGSLLVETGGDRLSLHSGAVRHITG